MSYDIEKEKREAIAAGENALRSLKKAKSELNSARGWGIYDLFGGGVISTAIKHSKMNKAADYIQQAKWDLKNFSRELEDVSEISRVDFGVGELATFADFFFDGVLADYFVQSKINKARGQVDEAIKRVERALKQLR